MERADREVVDGIHLVVGEDNYYRYLAVAGIHAREGIEQVGRMVDSLRMVAYCSRAHWTYCCCLDKVGVGASVRIDSGVVVRCCNFLVVDRNLLKTAVVVVVVDRIDFDVMVHH